MDPSRFIKAVSDNQLRAQLGNTMSVNVIERILIRVLPAAGLVKHGRLVDRWENGEAMEQIVGTVGCRLKEVTTSPFPTATVPVEVPSKDLILPCPSYSDSTDGGSPG